MYSFITPKPQLEKEALAINIFLQEELKTTCDDIQSHGDEIEIRGNKIAVYVARTGAMLADAKYHLNEALRSDILVTLIQQM